MNRDTLKTIAGLAVIAIIVVATFMYGNSQRQAQIKREQVATQQQEANGGSKTENTKSSTPTPASSPASASQSKPVDKNATAPVQTPTSNSIQGSSKQTSAPAPTPVPAMVPQTGQVSGTQTSTTSGTNSALPEAGSPLIGLLGAAAVVMMWFIHRRSKRAVFEAVRTRR